MLATPAEFMKCYEDGSITKMEFFHRLMMVVSQGTEADKEFILALDDHWTADLQQWLCCRPETEEDWANLRTVCIAMYARDTDWEVVKAMEKEDTRKVKKGVEFCRSILPPSSPPLAAVVS